MTDLVDSTSGLPSRRTLLGAAAWSVPVIAGVTATPAFAASTSPSINALRLKRPDLSDVNVGGNGGPIGIDLQVDYAHASSIYPNSITFAWALTVSGPEGVHSVDEGAYTIAKNATWQKNNVYYPSETTNLAPGSYDFTFTVSVAESGSSSSTAKLKI